MNAGSNIILKFGLNFGSWGRLINKSLVLKHTAKLLLIATVRPVTKHNYVYLLVRIRITSRLFLYLCWFFLVFLFFNTSYLKIFYFIFNRFFSSSTLTVYTRVRPRLMATTSWSKTPLTDPEPSVPASIPALPAPQPAPEFSEPWRERWTAASTYLTPPSGFPVTTTSRKSSTPKSTENTFSVSTCQTTWSISRY